MSVVYSQRVLTRCGPVPVKTLVGGEIELWNGHEFEFVKILMRTMISTMRVKLSNGITIHCSPDYIFYVPTLSRGGFRKTVLASSLKPGLVLARHCFPIIDPDVVVASARIQGMFSVSGRQSADMKTITCRNAKIAAELNADIGDIVDVTDMLRMDKSYVPTNACMESKRQWLTGFFDAMDVRFHRARSNTIPFRDGEFMKEIRDMLATCGIWVDLSFKKNDVVSMFVSADEAAALIDFLTGQERKPTEEGKTRFTLLSHPIISKKLRAPRKVTVVSVDTIDKPLEGYHIGSAMAF